MSKFVVMIGMDDVPHLRPPYITAEEIDELLDDALPHQKQARRTGRPSIGAGAIYPVDEDSIIVAPFKIPEHFERGWGFDVGWNKTAAILGARDPDTGVTYLTHEYYRGEAEPIIHAHNIKMMLPWPDLEGAIDPASAGSNQKDGSKLLDEYGPEGLGLELAKANNAVAAGIHHVLTMMQGGQLKVFSSLPYWLQEFRLYRRDEKGKIVKTTDHLMDAMRYLLFTDNLFTTRPRQRALSSRGRGEW